MLTKADLLAEMNRDIPAGVDWKAGARAYVASCFEKYGREPIERYSMNKPFNMISEGADPRAAIAESVGYLRNLTNALAFLQLRGGSRILDVGCGGGWVSHSLSKMGYRTFGIDISDDFIGLARKRLAADPWLGLTAEEAESRFAVHDIEAAPLPTQFNNSFDAIWLESCLHHLVDPISALAHLATALNDRGVIVLIEGENRLGPFKEQYLAVMREFATLERPYARSELERALVMAGLPCYEFVGTIDGWFSPRDPVAQNADQLLSTSAGMMNLTVCGKSDRSLARLFPHRCAIDALHFGRGFFENENGYRWCGPVGEITARVRIENLRIGIFSNLLALHRGRQIIKAYGSQAELARAVLTRRRTDREIVIGPLSTGETVTLHASEAIRPSWIGSDDKRLLSFCVRTDD
jgi:SAM-dependent methyltransferase